MAHPPVRRPLAALAASALLVGLPLGGCASTPAPPPQAASAAPSPAPPSPAASTPAPPPPLAAAPSPAPPPPANEPPLDTVVSDASARGVPILLVFHTVWCKPCAELEAKVLPEPKVVSALAGYRVQKYDAELGAGAEAAERFQVQRFPTLLVLSPKGGEIDRIYAQDADSIVRGLADVRLAALHAPVADDAVSRETDARTLLVTARLVAKGDGDRAARAYRAAIARDADPKKAIAAEAAFALVRLGARAEASRSHGKALVDFAARYPASDEALGAIDGLTALPPAARPDRATLLRVAPRVVAAHRAGKNEWSLRSLGASLTLLGDGQDAAKALEGLAPESKEAASATAMAPPKADPLADECVSQAIPPAFLALFEREKAISRRVVAACKGAPRNEDEEAVRLYIKDGRVERALLLDPEAPDALRKCMEAAARLEADLPAGFQSPSTVTVRFPHSKSE